MEFEEYEIDCETSHAYLASRLQYVTAPRTIYSTVHSRGTSLLHCLKRPDMTRVRQGS